MCTNERTLNMDLKEMKMLNLDKKKLVNVNYQYAVDLFKIYLIALNNSDYESDIEIDFLLKKCLN